MRILYECNPLSFVVEQAGGMAINCQLNRILDMNPKELHERTTIVIGSPLMVDEMKKFVERYTLPSYKTVNGVEA